MRRLAASLLALTAFALPAEAHLNSPHAYAEHRVAGHDVLVIVHAPEAVPGEGEIQVRVRDAAEGERITVRTRDIPPQGEERSPGWAEAERSDVDPKLWTNPLPLFLFGAWSVEVEIESEKGRGLIRVPFQAEVPRPTAMPWWLTSILALLCLLSVAAIWSILRAIGRHSRLPPGAEPGRSERRLGNWLAHAAAAVILAFLGFTIATWRLYDAGHWMLLAGTQLQLETFVVDQPARTGRLNELRMLVTDSAGQPLAGLEPVGERPMLATLVSLPGAESLSVLRVVQVNPGAFVTGLWPERTGRHRLFATVGREGGLSTLVADLDVAAGAPQPPAKVPGLRVSRPPLGELLDARRESFPDGASLTWLREPGAVSRVQEFERLSFRLAGPEGAPPDPAGTLEGELLLMRADGEVFARLTPTGSLGVREPGGEQSPVQAGPGPREPGRIDFPYAFPVEGRYRLWVLLHQEGGSRIAAFDVDVLPSE